jgi:hypothetical protein
MSRKRITELLKELELAAKEDEAAGRMIWAANQRELVKLIRQTLEGEKERWRKWYHSPKGKEAQQRKKERGALGPHKNDEIGPSLK